MIEEGGQTPETWIEFGFRVVTSVRPSPEEAAILLALYGEERAMFAWNPEAARAQLAIGAAAQVWGTRVAEHAALTRVARVLLNLSAATYQE